MNGSLFVAYLVTIALLMLTPGPDMLFCLATGLRSGSRTGFRAALGAATGEVIHISAAALQFLVLGACFVVLEIVVDGTVGLVAGRIAGLVRRRRVRRNLNVVAGSIYTGLGVRLALDR